MLRTYWSTVQWALSPNGSKEMSWSGTWIDDKTYVGTYTADGRVFRGAWTRVHLGFSNPYLSSDSPFFSGAPTNDSDAHRLHWFGVWDDTVWAGKYEAPAGTPGGTFEFAGTMTLHG